MSKSRANGISASLGMGVGAMTFALLASVGLYVVLETVPWAYLLFKVVGGIYLCVLAYKLWHLSKEPHVQSDKQSTSNSIFRSFFLGLFTQLSNPKTAIVFAGVFAAFMPAEVPAYSYPLLCLLAFTIDALWYSLVTVVLSTPKAQNTYARYKNYICKTSSCFIGLVGIKLVADQ